MEQDLKTLRAEIDAQREARGTAGSQAATLTAELRHTEEACVADLGVEASVLREDAELAAHRRRGAGRPKTRRAAR